MEGSTRLQVEAFALVARLRESLLRPGDLPTRFRRWLVVGRAEARRYRRVTGQCFEQSPSRQIRAASASLARQEGLCPEDADEATALLAYLRSLGPANGTVIAEQVIPPPPVSSLSADVATDANPWQPEPESPAP
jgi:hypothetical protein